MKGLVPDLQNTVITGLFITMGGFSGGCAPDHTGDYHASRTPRTAEAVETTGDAGNIPAGLLQAEFFGIYDTPITLTEGRYAGPAFVAGGSSRPRVTLLQELVTQGDLDADSADEYAVVLAENSGGSGSFIYLALLRPRGNAFVNFATTLLGDRIQVNALNVVGGTIRASVLVHGPGDPACCPSEHTQRSWLLIADRLSEIKTYRGNLIYGHETRAFTLCEAPGGEEPRGDDNKSCTGTAWWVADGTGGDLPAAYRTLAVRPYAPVYVEVRGAVGPSPNAEFARPYERQLKIVELKRAGKAHPGTD